MFSFNQNFRRIVQTLYFLHLWNIVGFIFYIISRIIILLGFNKLGLSLLLKSIRCNYNTKSTIYLKSIIGKEKDTFIRLANNPPKGIIPTKRTIILSLPHKNNNKIIKGVLLITYTSTFSYFIKQDWFSLLDNLFIFVLEPSSAGYADPDILSFLLKSKHCLVQATELRDRIFMNILFPEGRVVSFGASDWVDPKTFKASKSNKIYDSIYVANLNPCKRIFRYIDAISKIVDVHNPDYKSCLVCAPWGGNSGKMKNYITSYIKNKGIESNIELILGLSRKKLIQKLDQCKVSILLSFKEGSNRAIFEAMLIGLPVICISENIGVNKNYVNEFTGLLVPDRCFEDALVAMQDNWKLFKPRKWALENISPFATTAKLSTILNEKYGDNCNTSLFIKTNNPELEYVNKTENFLNNEAIEILFDAFMTKNEEMIWSAIDKINQDLFDVQTISS